MLIAHQKYGFLQEYAPVVSLMAVIGAYLGADGLHSSGFMAVFVTAFALLTDAIDVNLRPVSRAMWQETIPPEEPLRLRALLVDTLSAWRLPLATILGFLAVVVGVGSVVRSGLLDGGAYTLRYLIVTGLILWASTSLARLRWQWAPTIAVLTLLVLPPAILLSDHFIGDALLGLPQDPTGQIVVALQTPVTTILIAMAVQAARERQQVLAGLQARIDAVTADDIAGLARELLTEPITYAAIGPFDDLPV